MDDDDNTRGIASMNIDGVEENDGLTLRQAMESAKGLLCPRQLMLRRKELQEGLPIVS